MKDFENLKEEIIDEVLSYGTLTGMETILDMCNWDELQECETVEELHQTIDNVRFCLTDYQEAINKLMFTLGEFYSRTGE